jgi:hypothetical protein
MLNGFRLGINTVSRFLRRVGFCRCEAAGETDRTVEYAGLYSLDYFGSMIFDRISTQDFYQYWDWRKVNFKRRKPSDDTLNRERSAIMSIFKFGYQRGYVKELLHIPKLKTNGINRRPTSTRRTSTTVGAVGFL